MGYWTYYLGFVLLAYVTRYPWLLAGILGFWLLRRFIPDPFVFLRTMGRMRVLRAQVSANPSNVTARRDLARLYLERLRPRAALVLLDAARTRDPHNPELLYLTGLARLRTGDAEGALAPLVESVARDPRAFFGDAFLAAGDALVNLGRWDEAEDAYERFVHANTSSVEGFVKLARTRAAKRDPIGAKRALDEALHTFHLLPGFKRRRQFGWWMRARVARLFAG